jgi:hypothetical protein
MSGLSSAARLGPSAPDSSDTLIMPPGLVVRYAFRSFFLVAAAFRSCAFFSRAGDHAGGRGLRLAVGSSQLQPVHEPALRPENLLVVDPGERDLYKTVRATCVAGDARQAQSLRRQAHGQPQAPIPVKIRPVCVCLCVFALAGLCECE